VHFPKCKKPKNIILSEVIEKLSVVQVSVWAGKSPENKKKIVEGITQVIHEVGGVPREAITIILYEVPKTDWASGGQLHSERFADR
jgi:4-oxalocrotonate tautomerase